MGTTEKILYILINSYLWENKISLPINLYGAKKKNMLYFFLAACIQHRSCWISNVPCGYTLGNEKWVVYLQYSAQFFNIVDMVVKPHASSPYGHKISMLQTSLFFRHPQSKPGGWIFYRCSKEYTSL